MPSYEVSTTQELYLVGRVKAASVEAAIDAVECGDAEPGSATSEQLVVTEVRLKGKPVWPTPADRLKEIRSTFEAAFAAASIVGIDIRVSGKFADELVDGRPVLSLGDLIFERATS